MLDRLHRFIAYRYLRSRSKRHIADFPQLRLFAFDYVSIHIMLDGRYENSDLDCLARHVFPLINTKQSTCLDIGANIGNHSLFFARHFKRVVAFEPNPMTFELLAINSRLVGNIEPLAYGCSDKAQDLPFVFDANNIGATRVHADGGPANNSDDDAKSRLVLKRLDETDVTSGDTRISFIKLDVEGHELSALKGAERVLRTHQPVVALEINRPDIANGSSASLDYLRQLGYRHIYRLRATLRSPWRKRLVEIQTLDYRTHNMIIVSVSPLSQLR